MYICIYIYVYVCMYIYAFMFCFCKLSNIFQTWRDICLKVLVLFQPFMSLLHGLINTKSVNVYVTVTATR